MSHYFLNDESVKNDEQMYDVQIQGTSFRFYTNHGVFSKQGLDYGTKFLLENVQINQEIKTVIDMGCGYGPIGIFMAKSLDKASVYMYDVNLRALDLAQKNAKTNKVENVFIKQSSLFEAVNVSADLIITNPPIRAGKQTVFKLYEDAYKHLGKNGLFYSVIQKKQGAPSSFKKLVEIYGACEVVAKSKGYYVLLARKY